MINEETLQKIKAVSHKLTFLYGIHQIACMKNDGAMESDIRAQIHSTLDLHLDLQNSLIRESLNDSKVKPKS